MEMLINNEGVFEAKWLTGYLRFGFILYRYLCNYLCVFNITGPQTYMHNRHSRFWRSRCTTLEQPPTPTPRPATRTRPGLALVNGGRVAGDRVES